VTLVLGEVVTLGVAAGPVGAGLSAGLISALGLHLPLSRALLVVPVAARAPRRGGRRVRTFTGLAITGIIRTPGQYEHSHGNCLPVT